MSRIAAPCSITRQRISRFDRSGSPPPRATPMSPAASTPSTPSIASPARIAIKIRMGGV